MRRGFRIGEVCRLKVTSIDSKRARDIADRNAVDHDEGLTGIPTAYAHLGRGIRSAARGDIDADGVVTALAACWAFVTCRAGWRCLKYGQAATTAVRHVSIAAARSVRCVWADVRWRWTLKVL